MNESGARQTWLIRTLRVVRGIIIHYKETMITTDIAWEVWNFVSERLCALCTLLSLAWAAMQRIFSNEGSLGLARGPPIVITDELPMYLNTAPSSDILSGRNQPLDQEFRGDADSALVDDFEQLHRDIYFCLSRLPLFETLRNSVERKREIYTWLITYIALSEFPSTGAEGSDQSKRNAHVSFVLAPNITNWLELLVTPPYPPPSPPSLPPLLSIPPPNLFILRRTGDYVDPWGRRAR